QQVKTFIRTEVAVMLEDELQLQRAGTRFDYTNPDVLGLEQQTKSILILSYAFPRDEFLKRLDDTAHLLINYLLRPQWTLTGVLFEREDRRAVRDIRRFMNYLSAYEYLRDIFNRYADERHLQEIGKEEFSRLIWKVDSEFVKRKSGKDIAQLLSPV